MVYELTRLEVLSVGCAGLEFLHGDLDVEPLGGHALDLIESLLLHLVLLQGCLVVQLGLLLGYVGRRVDYHVRLDVP